MDLDLSVLEGRRVRQVRLTAEQLPELTAVALANPEIWEHIPYRMSTAADIARTLGALLAVQERGDILLLATRLAETGELVGGTSIRRSDALVPSAEIGGTWISPRFQRTFVNTEAKLLQLTACFERLHCERVELKTDIRNLRSQAAILRLGATREGVLRKHMRRADGTLRDTVMFSILAEEWPAVGARLRAWLEAA
jgi:RimJ/RimL family protein N-acetyltransferase